MFHNLCARPCVPSSHILLLDASSAPSSRDQRAEQAWRCRGSAIPRVWKGVGVFSMFNEPPAVLRAGGSKQRIVEYVGEATEVGLM